MTKRASGEGTDRHAGATETDQHIAEEKVRELLGEFRTAMLVTRTTAGELRARPMVIAEAAESGLLTFITSMESGKVDEIQTDAHVAITMQSGSAEEAGQGGPFMSITGWAELDRTPAEIERLYEKVDDVWFEGPADPRIALIRVRVHSAEYWDQRGLANRPGKGEPGKEKPGRDEGVRFAWQAVKAVAVARGGRPDAGDRQHGVLNH